MAVTVADLTEYRDAGRWRESVCDDLIAAALEGDEAAVLAAAADYRLACDIEDAAGVEVADVRT